MRVVAAWLAVLAVFAGLGVGSATAAHADTGSDEAEFLALTNQLRSSLGVQTLTSHGELVSIARAWSAQMASAGDISHNPNLPNQVTAKWSKLGENVGTGGAVGVIQTAFINSPGHYANLAKPDYNFVGIGVVYGAANRIYVTVVFMQAAGSAAPAPAPKPAAPKPAPAPKPATAPGVTTPKPAAPPVTTPPVTAPPPAPPAPEPVRAKSSLALNQVLAQLRTLDS